MIADHPRSSEMLPCPACGMGVPRPLFPATSEGLKAAHDYEAMVDNHEGKSPEFCEECEKTFTEIRPPHNNGKPPRVEPKVISQFRGITQNGMGGVENGDGKRVMVDSFSASHVIAVYDAINEKSKNIFVEKFGNNPVKMVSVAFKALSKSKVTYG